MRNWQKELPQPAALPGKEPLMKTFHPLSLEMVIAIDDEKLPYPLLNSEVAVAEMVLALLPQQITRYAQIHSARITAGLMDEETAVAN